jgi:hypothetical protein
MSENKSPFTDLKVPQPPDDLRAQVLSRAREAMEQGPRQDLWSRIWESRQLRLAWGMSVIALAVCHIVIPGPAGEPSTLSRNQSDGQDELEAITDLPRISLDVLPAFVATRPPEESEENES